MQQTPGVHVVIVAKCTLHTNWIFIKRIKDSAIKNINAIAMDDEQQAHQILQWQKET